MTQNCNAAPAMHLIMAALNADMLIIVGTWQEQLAGAPVNYHYHYYYYYHHYFVDHDEWALDSSHSRVLI